MNKLIITAALTGAEVMKDQQPALPISPEEITKAAYDCFLSGASIVHIHARDSSGKPTQNLEVYREIKERIAEKCDLIFQPSTGGAVWHQIGERAKPLELNPEMATLSAGTCNFGEDVFFNSQDTMETFAREMKARGIKPEIEVFERGMIENAFKLLKKGLIDSPVHFDFVLGVPGACPGNIEDLIHMVRAIPQGSTWTVAGIGRNELTLATAAILLGGHVRVGFEDNIYYKKGELAISNAQLVQRVVRISNELGRDVASPEEAREILGIRRKSQ
ncbi:MAG: 3-keto-5-aminohexanoate cleavage protein [Kosmotogaceae bacterium]|nr:3-keto-5-aminohexanoate cleavage protein [Kosmotogaceae bacterium]